MLCPIERSRWCVDYRFPGARGVLRDEVRELVKVPQLAAEIMDMSKQMAEFGAR